MREPRTAITYTLAALAAAALLAGPLAPAALAQEKQQKDTVERKAAPPGSEGSEKKAFPFPGKAGPGGERKRPAVMMDFGPLEDGDDQKAHEDLIRLGWIYLFDSRIPSSANSMWNGKGLWRARHPAKDKWKASGVQGGWILANEVKGHGEGSDLVSLLEFWDCDVHAEIRVPEGSNSGLYLRGRYEIQILDTKPDAKELKTSDLGAIYNVAAPSVNASKGPGQWQTLEAQIRGFRVSVRLNGQVVQENVEIPEKFRGGTGSQLTTHDGTYSDDPNSPGPIFLQGDHGSVEFKNVRVRPVRSYMAAYRLPGGKAAKAAPGAPGSPVDEKAVKAAPGEEKGAKKS
jgi:hypothetical protein